MSGWRWIITAGALGLLFAYAAWGRRPERPATPVQRPVPPLPQPVEQAPPPKKSPAVKTRRPSVLKLEPAEVRFGEIAPESTQEIVVTVRNPSAQAIHITDAWTTCSCGRAKLADKEIPAGGQTTLELQYHADRGKRADDRGHCFLRTNEPGRPTVTLPFSAQIHYSFVMEPAAVNFGDVPRGETREQTVRVRSVSGKPFVVRQIAAGRGDFTFLWEKEPARAEYAVTVRFAPTGAAGQALENAVILTADEWEKVVPLTVAGNVVGNAVLVPPALVLPPTADGSPPDINLEVRPAGRAAAVAVTGVKDSGERKIEFTATPAKNGAMQLKIKILGAWPKDETTAGTLLIQTDAEKEPLRFYYRVGFGRPR
jgi:hypothetical protein